MKAYKGFNQDMTCRGFQFEVGKTYIHDGEVKLCESGFHACEAPLDVLNYYPPTALFAEVELDGVSEETHKQDTKRVSKSLTVKAAIDIAGLVKAQVEWCSKKSDAAFSKGNYSTAASSGYYSTAASSGYYSKAASSGDYSKAASSGYYSTAESNGKQTIAMVAGLEGKARAGINGAFALPWLDGEQVRIAVGIIGENAKADIWYCVKDGVLAEC